MKNILLNRAARIRVFSFIAILTLVLTALYAPPARAATLCVNPGGTDGCLATISAAITAANPNDTIIVAAGTYAEALYINKPLTLLGANAGIHPAVGTHPTEVAGARGPESILSNNYPAISPSADNITIDGFKFTGSAGRIIDTYSNANNFHLTNCIFDNPARGQTTGVIQFGGGSHTGMLVDFNLFQDKGDHTLYLGGGPYDQLQVVYNRFNVEGDSFFWAATPLVDGVIEGNEFDGTIGGNPGTGMGTINIGQAGNIAIRNNWFHDQLYNPMQVGIIGGSITGNTFERIYPYSTYGADAIQLWGGQWGTAVSTDVDISNNTIRYNDIPAATLPSHGIRLRPAETGAGIDGTTIHIHGNSILSGAARTDAMGIRHDGNPARLVDAALNWWGTSSGPFHAALNPTGTGGAVGDYVDFTPWLGAPTSESASGVLTDGESLSLPGSAVSATFDSPASGSASVTLATYTGNPGSDVTGFISAGNSFYDLYVADLTDPDATLTVVVQAGADGQILRYWDGTAWSSVISNDGTIPVAVGGAITVVFGPNSHPRLDELAGTPIVSSAPEAIQVQFADTQVVQGQPVIAQVVAKSTNLYGVEVHLSFDPNKLQVGSVSLGGGLAAGSIGQNNYNNSTGRINFAFTQTSPTLPKAGDDILLATITFFGGLSGGSAIVGYAPAYTIFSDPDGMSLGSTEDGSLHALTASVTVVEPGSLSGAVRLQGRTNHSGTTITTETDSSLQAATNAAGAFSLSGLIPGNVYTNLKAGFPGYLSAQRDSYVAVPGADSTSLPLVTLPGGDANRDQTINILDLAFIGRNFGGTTAQADINGDGTVNILDLAMAGSNYEKDGPIDW